MAGVWKTVRVFISSTFRDMHAERDHLVKVVFPALRERLEPYRVHLSDIDLRWGVTREQAENEQALELCLQQVDECRPFFLGLLGERYGWVPDAFPADLLARHGWVKHHAGKSVTDLEMLYGVVASRDSKRRAFFYFRDPAALDTVPDDRRADFVDSHAEQVRKLRALKDRIRRHGYPLFDGYPASWDAGAYDRPSRSDGRLGGLEDFGRRVQEDLWQAIQAELNLPNTPPTETVTDPLAEELDYHERFMESRLRVYIGRDEVQRRLLEFADGDAVVPCLVSGPSGAGKSAALARFFTHYRQQHPDVLAVPHFIGSSPRSTSLRQLLRRLCLVLKSRFGFEDEVPEETVPLRVTFRNFLARVPADSRGLLVIDALNQLDEAEGGQDLQWLPPELPPQVKVVVSCIADPDRPETVLEAFARRPHQALPLEPLRDEERREIIRAVPSLSAKTLDDSQVGLLLSNPATANPLFLLVALEELRGFGSYDQLTERIDSLPREGDTVTALFDQVLARLEEEFGKELVRVVLALLASARRGLSEQELHSLTASLPGADDLFVVLRQLRPYLLRRGGLVDFYHRNLFKAVRARYLAVEEVGRTAHACLAEFFEEQDYRLASSPQQRPINVRKVDELLWQRLHAREVDEAADLLLDLVYLEAKAEAGMVFELAGEFTAVTEALPQGNRRRLLELLEEGLRHDIHFIHRHYRDYPQGLFQSLWNSCWWYDCPEAQSHYEDGREPGQVTGVGLHKLLEAWRVKKEQATPGFVWLRSQRPLAVHLGTPLRAVFRGHEGGVRSVTYSPDGRYIASGSLDDTVRTWDATSGEQILSLRMTLRGFMAVRYSSDGERIVACADNGEAQVWDVRTGEQLPDLGQYPAVTKKECRAPDGKTIARASSGLVQIFDAENQTLRRELEKHHLAAAQEICYSSDGQRIAAAKGRRVCIWDTENGQIVSVFHGHERIVHSVSYSPNGRYVCSGSDDDTVRVWDTQAEGQLSHLKGEQEYLKAVTYSQDGRQLYCQSWYVKEPITVWDAASGVLMRTIPAGGVLGDTAPEAVQSSWRAVIQNHQEVTIQSTTTGEHIAYFPISRWFEGRPHPRPSPGGKSWAMCSFHYFYLFTLESSPDGQVVSR
jgi:hypothetical protein